MYYHAGVFFFFSCDGDGLGAALAFFATGSGDTFSFPPLFLLAERLGAGVGTASSGSKSV